MIGGAKAADQSSVFVARLDRGGDGPRVAVKDTIDISGLATKCGSRALEGAPFATKDADVVARMLAAGCRIVGKTNLHELAFGVTGINDWTGTPNNPRFPGVIPGGSSSGSAAAVAAGLVDFAIGSDTGGSIRVPAACCGIVGFKPTFGRVSRVGVTPVTTSLDCVGPFASGVAGVAAAMAIIDATFAARPARAGRLGVVQTICDPVVQEALNRVADVAGGEPCVLDGMQEAFDAGMTVINAENWIAFGPLVETGKIARDVAERLRDAAKERPSDVARAEIVRAQFVAAVDTLLARFDALLLPTLPVIPPTVEIARANPTAASLTTLVRPFNLSGHPAIALPLPPASNGPLSLQMVGRRGGDADLCALALHVEAVIAA